MNEILEKDVAVDGPVVNEGERSSSTFSTGQGPLVGSLERGQRWTVRRKQEAVLRLLRGESVELLSRELGVEVYRLETWREKAMSGMDMSLKERKGDPLQAELDTARGNEPNDLSRHGPGLRRGAGLCDLGCSSFVVLCRAAAEGG